MLRAGMLAATSAALLVPAAAAGAPRGNGLDTTPAVCAGQETVVTHSAGSTFWLGDDHYVITVFTGTFTPVGGEPETFTKTSGNKNGLGPTITCTGSESDASGTFAFEVTGALVK